MVIGMAVEEVVSLFCLWCVCAAQEKIFFSAFEGGASILCFYIYLEIENNLPKPDFLFVWILLFKPSALVQVL